MLRKFLVVATGAAALGFAPGAHAAAPSILEAESTTTSTGATVVYSDSQASAGKYRKFLNNSSTSFSYTSSRDLLTVRARPEACDGDPQLQVSVVSAAGATVLASVAVDQSGWSAYQFALPAATSSSTIKVAFTNDYGSSSCNRNLMVDAIALSDRQSSGASGASLTVAPSAAATTSGTSVVLGAAATATLTTSEPISSVDIDAAASPACAGTPHLQVSVDGSVVGTYDIAWDAVATQRVTLPRALWVEPHTVEIAFIDPDPAPGNASGCGRGVKLAAVRANSSVMTAPPTPGPATITALETHRSFANVTIDITGTNLTSVTRVRFGAATAPIVDQGSVPGTGLSHIHVVIPVGTWNSTVDVIAESPYGDSVAGSATAFTWIGPPTLTSISPAQGPAAGGTNVTITGTNLDGVGTVKFSGVPATIVSKSPTTLVATSPAGNPGMADVRATNLVLGRTTLNTAADDFKYIAPGDLWFAPIYDTPALILKNSSVTGPDPLLNQWTDEHEPKDSSGNKLTDRVQVVTGSDVPGGSNPASKPAGAMKVTVAAGDLTVLSDGNTHPRSEALVDRDRWTEGKTAWVDFWVYVPTSTVFTDTDPDRWSTLMQWKGGTGSPVIGLEVNRTNDHYILTSNQFSGINGDLGAIVHDRWQHIKLGVKFASDPALGTIDASLDGTPISRITAQTIGAPGGPNTTLYLKQGLYQGYDWHTATADRVVYYGPVRVATTEALAEQR